MSPRGPTPAGPEVPGGKIIRLLIRSLVWNPSFSRLEPCMAEATITSIPPNRIGHIPLMDCAKKTALSFYKGSAQVGMQVSALQRGSSYRDSDNSEIPAVNRNPALVSTQES